MSKEKRAALRLSLTSQRNRDYRYLVEAEKDARHYYVVEFSTNGDWQDIRIALRKMVPIRRGDRLEIPDYPAKTMSQARFMIANGLAEAFRLEVASIRLERAASPTR